MRFIRICWLTVLLLFACAGAAQAQPEHAPYDLELSLRYRALTQGQRQLFDRLYDSVWAGEACIPLPEKTDYDEVSALVQLLVKDMPELCAVDSRYRVGYFRDTPAYANELYMFYTQPLETQPVLMDQAQALVSGLQGSAPEKELWLHDLLCGLTAYSEGSNCYSAYGALVDGQAVCEGYAKAFALLCRLSGIPCSVADGMSLDGQGQMVFHAWNQVELDGVTAWVDVTWDDQQGGLYWYVNLTDEQIGRDHVLDEGQLLASCTDDRYEWHRMRGQTAPAGQGRDALFRAFAQVAAGQGPVSIRFEDEREFQAIAADVSACWDDYNAQAPEARQMYGSVSWAIGETQWVLRLARPE